MSNHHASPPRRQAVLIAVHPDGYIEVFGDKSIDVKIARFPVAETVRGELISEACFLLALPLRHRELFDRRLLRANGTARPLTPEVARAALQVKRTLPILDKIGDLPREAVA